MVVRFEKCELKIDQIHKEEFSKESFASHENKVIELIQSWLRNDSHFTFKTSGSTGTAKTILIEREKVEYSCNATMEKLDPGRKFKSALLCISPEMIGGAMVVFRSLTRNLNLRVVKPSSNPLEQIEQTDKFDLTSLVPLQLDGMRGNQLDNFSCILVGGGSLDRINLKTSAQIYSTFGMTETVSHFALRLSDEEIYECVGDTQVETYKSDRLAVRGTITNHKLLVTNDLIEFISTKKFKWIGRSDIVINSGGVKINPEKVERILRSQLAGNFIVSYLKDSVLENKVILIVEGTPFEMELNFSNLEKYEKPKKIHFVDKFILTRSQKVDRIKTRERLLTSLNLQS